MAGRGIGYNELSISLQQRIDAGGTGGSGTVINVTPEYTHIVRYDKQDLIENIVFVDGEDIFSFNRQKDSLAVYKDGLRLTEDVDYAININGISIDSLKGGWIITEDVETVFIFVVKKNTTAGIDFGIATDEEILGLFD